MLSSECERETVHLFERKKNYSGGGCKVCVQKIMCMQSVSVHDERKVFL